MVLTWEKDEIRQKRQVKSWLLDDAALRKESLVSLSF